MSLRVAMCALLLGALALACASTERRIAKQQDVFDAYPPEIQQKIRNGEVAVGFTQEQVRMALGEPDRRTHVTTEDAIAELWIWTKSIPGIGFGIGTGSRVGNVGIGTGVRVGEGARREDVRVLEFVNGRVSRIETALED